jgi:hypothetical protein
MTTRSKTGHNYLLYTAIGSKANINFESLIHLMHAAPVNVRQNLYRVTTPNKIEQLLKNGYLNTRKVTSFTYNKKFANNYQKRRNANQPIRNHRYMILGPGRYPGINSTRNSRFRSAFPYEKEVTIAPGTYFLQGITPNGHLKVTYTPHRPH